MASDDIWILGINMTKFGKYPDKDVVDLASEAVLAALADGGVTMADIGILAAGNLMGPGGIGQQIQKQVGQTGIPVFNVSNACATGATALRTAIMAVKAGEVDMGLAVGVEKLAGVGECGQHRFGREVDDVLVGVLAELGHVDSEDPDVVTCAHGYLSVFACSIDVCVKISEDRAPETAAHRHGSRLRRLH